MAKITYSKEKKSEILKAAAEIGAMKAAKEAGVSYTLVPVTVNNSNQEENELKLSF